MVTSFTSGEKSIAIIIGAAACLSVFSIAILAARVGVATIRPLIQGLKGRKETREALFFRTQLGAYVTCLLISNLLSGVAGFFGFSWARKGGIAPGSECTTQGSLIQIGDFAGAYFTAVIAIHTFQTLVLHKKSSSWVVIFAVAFGWGSAVALGTALSTISTSAHGPFFNGVGLWCAISSGYTVEQFVAYYLPIIISALVTASLYAIIYLCLRGTLVIGDGIKLNLSAENVQGWAGRLNGREEYRHFLGAIIRSLLWFPFAFIVLFLPITIAGLMRISGITNPDGLLGLAGVAASLNGLVNVLILYNTMRILRPAISSNTVSMASESFFVPEERKPSPIEAPKPMPFSDKSSIVSPTPRSARSMQHGRAFPPPVSRVGSPLSSTGSAYGLPATPRSGRPPAATRYSEDQRAEHAPTQEMREMWLRHQRSTSSVDSTTTLLRAASPSRYGHSRNGSTSTSSENIHVLIGKPILPSGEITRRVDADVVSVPSRNDAITPAPAIMVTRPTTPESSGLPPPPRPPRGDTIRESLLNVNMKLAEMPPVPPMPPVPNVPSSHSSVYTQPDVPLDSKHEDHESVEGRSSTPKTPMTSRSIGHSHSTRTSMSFEQEDFEIQRVDSRERLRPAISAVARLPLSSTSADESPLSKNGMGMASVVSLPESVGGASMITRETSESEDTLHAEIRSRASTLNSSEGALSSIAWASLVAHAAVSERLTGDAMLQWPIESDTWADDRDGEEELRSPQARRLSNVPMVLRPGTPESVGSDMYFRFNSLGPSRQPQNVDERASESNPDLNRNTTLGPVTGPGIRQMRSFNGIGTSQHTRRNRAQLGRSSTRYVARRDGPPGYI